MLICDAAMITKTDTSTGFGLSNREDGAVINRDGENCRRYIEACLLIQ